jgi:hypothetical protein
MPPAPGVNAADVAVPPLSVTVVPTGLPPPLAQPLEVVKGPHTKKLTVPVGAGPPALPVTVALSVFEPPKVIVKAEGALVVTDDA